MDDVSAKEDNTDTVEVGERTFEEMFGEEDQDTFCGFDASRPNHSSSPKPETCPRLHMLQAHTQWISI